MYYKCQNRKVIFYQQLHKNKALTKKTICIATNIPFDIFFENINVGLDKRNENSTTINSCK